MHATSFLDATSIADAGDQRFIARVPEGWAQGRGAFGGLAIGLCVRAMERTAGHPLRTLTAELPGPLLPGDAVVRVTELRRGSGTTVMEAHVKQGGETKVRASAVFGRLRDDDRKWSMPPPRLSDWRTVEPMSSDFLPEFAKNFEYRVTGPLPFSSHAEPIVEGWIRLAHTLDVWGAAEVVALADAYWPAAFATQDSFRPSATIAFSIQLTDRAHHLPAHAPLYHRSRALAADGGYIFELRELWTADGELVALNPQTFVTIK